MIDQKFDVVLHKSQHPNIPQKCLSAQNGALDVRSQIRQTPTMEPSDLRRNPAKTMMQSF